MPWWVWLIISQAMFVLGMFIRNFTMRRYLECFHHDPKGGWAHDGEATSQSHVRAELIEAGMRKRFWCRKCGHQWFT